MISTKRSVLILLGALAVAPLAVIACSSDDAPRGSPTPDAAVEAALPDAGDLDGTVVDARGPFDPNDEAVTCDASPCVMQIVAGDDHFCARIADGTVRCWGDNEKGQLGFEPDGGDPASKPTVEALTGAAQISAAGTTTCARVGDGGVLCWGGNEDGELGRGIDPDQDPHPLPEAVALDPAVVVDRIDVGQRSSCVTTSAGAAFCWGNDESAQLARGEPGGPGLPPGPADLGVAVKRTAAGIDTGFALAEDGRLLSWGAVAGAAGALAGRISSVTPTPIASPALRLALVSSIAVSGPTPALIPPGSIPGVVPPPNQHACAVAGGELYCWGKSERGALGSGLPDTVIPIPSYASLRTAAYAQQVAAGGETTCVRLTNGGVSCTGENERGQLGIGTAGPFSSTFVAATSLSGRAVQVAVAKATVCALMQGGTVSCWGSNTHGELGLGTRDDDAHPSSAPVPF